MEEVTKDDMCHCLMHCQRDVSILCVSINCRDPMFILFIMYIQIDARNRIILIHMMLYIQTTFLSKNKNNSNNSSFFH